MEHIWYTIILLWSCITGKLYEREWAMAGNLALLADVFGKVFK